MPDSDTSQKPKQSNNNLDDNKLDDKVTLTTKMQALRRAQARLGGPMPPGTKLVSEELIEDRAVAARMESGDAQDRP